MADNKANKDEAKKAKRPTALKRDMQNERLKMSNRSYKARVATSIRSLKETSKSEKPALLTKLNEVYSLIDKGVKKGIFKKNKADRVKSQMSSLVK